MRFWYHMYGPDIGAINVYARTTFNGPLTKQFTKVGNQGDQWKRASITFTVTQPFQVVFEAVNGPYIWGDIAIDDISFTTACNKVNTPLPVATRINFSTISLIFIIDIINKMINLPIHQFINI